MNIDLSKLTRQELIAYIDHLERRLKLQDKYTFNREEIIQALGLEGQQKNTWRMLINGGYLHSPICQKPYEFPNSVVYDLLDHFEHGTPIRKKKSSSIGNPVRKRTRKIFPKGVRSAG